MLLKKIAHFSIYIYHITSYLIIFKLSISKYHVCIHAS